MPHFNELIGPIYVHTNGYMHDEGAVQELARLKA